MDCCGDEIPMFAISAERLEWWPPDPPDIGIFLFFLLLVFSHDS